MWRIVLGVCILSIFRGEALAADMPARLSAKAPVIVSPTWSGFYAGINAGWGWSTAKATGSAAGPVAADFAGIPPLSANANGGLFGFQLGYNWQIASWVLGMEGDIDAA